MAKFILPVTCDADGSLRRLEKNAVERFQDNLKTLDQPRYEKLKNSFLRHGFFCPVFVWNGKLLDGHQRLHVLDTEDWDVDGGIPYVSIEAENEQDAAEKLLIISSTYGKVDKDGLWEFAQNHSLRFDDATLPDLSDLPDFDMKGFEQEFYPAPENLPTDDVPEVPEIPRTKEGEMWILGDHLLLCGDATALSVGSRLFGDAQASLGLTSPPYALGKEYEVEVTFKQHIEILEGVADRGLEFIKPGGFFFVNFSPIAPMEFAKPLTGSDAYGIYPIEVDYWRIFHVERRYDLYAQRIWYKAWTRLAMPYWTFKTSKAHQNEWENIWTWRLPGAEGDEVYDWDVSSRAVWNNAAAEGEAGATTKHPAAFPVYLPNRAIKAHTNEGDVVWEPFAGAGTTIVACEHLKRKCRATELDPAYVDVSVLRWQELTGLQATLYGTGETFDSRADTA